ncbi:phosphatase PAP2 family protein [Flexithrix dorotheae]|uniref:phosphatase PAP2 family protein n=1 Tax=Flexithrix dorotheae TaxID=70993 RepID=UPI000377835F|nr:phosphatase PAP2 family protein [Flexithrix dorotheae]
MDKKGFNQLFSISLAIYIFLLFPFIFMEKGVVCLTLNATHNPILDYFFKYFTAMGNGAIFGLAIIGCLFIRFYYAVLVAIVGIFHGLVVYLFKQFLFFEAERPLGYFGDLSGLNFVEGVDQYYANSFPSGHTASAFALAIIFILILNKRRFILPIFSLAILVGISRIYLLHHFFIDTFCGSLIGIFSAIITWFLMERYTKIKHQNWANSFLTIGFKNTSPSLSKTEVLQ